MKNDLSWDITSFDTMGGSPVKGSDELIGEDSDYN